MKSLTATLTRSQKEAQYIFLEKHKLLKKAEKQLSSEQQVSEYLKEIYGVEVPEDFPEELGAAHATFHGNEFSISFDSIDAVVSACDLWKEYIAKTTDYNRLICEQVLSMIRIHAAVIATRDIVKSDIQLRKQPSYVYSVQVTYDGLIVVYD